MLILHQFVSYSTYLKDFVGVQSSKQNSQDQNVSKSGLEGAWLSGKDQLEKCMRTKLATCLNSMGDNWPE